MANKFPTIKGSGFGVEFEEKKMLAIIDELGQLGEPKWVIGRYQAGLKKAMRPVLELAKSNCPVDSGNLRNSLNVTAKKEKKTGLASARVGVDVDKVFINKAGEDFAIPPAVYVASVEFGNKKGMSPRPFLAPAYDATGRKEHILPRLNDFMRAAVKKRTKFLRKGVK